MDIQKEEFLEWVKSENPLLVDEAESGSQFHKDILDYMFMGWVAKAQKVAVSEDLILDKPAKVASGTFGIGVKWSTVIGAAQRQFEYAQNNISEATNIQDLKGILFDVPEGFVLVPREPTKAMIDAGHDFCKSNIVTPSRFYKAMIEARRN